MPTGDPGRRPARHPQRGFTYLVLLFALALAAAALSALGPLQQQAAQRERELALQFNGQQLRDALQRFHDQTPDGQPTLPQALDELLVDTRRPQPRHHLRQLYPDPFTGRADWVLQRTPDGGITGLHSRSAQPLLRQPGAPPAPALAWRAMDLKFAIQPRRPGLATVAGNTP